MFVGENNRVDVLSRYKQKPDLTLASLADGFIGVRSGFYCLLYYTKQELLPSGLRNGVCIR